jgi:YD repeat-containing protein
MNELTIDGVIRERRDDTTRTVTTYDEQGNITSERPYTAEENAAADQAALEATLNTNKRTVEQKLATKLANMQTILVQTNADLRTDPSQEIKDMARAIRLLVRMQMIQFDGAE